MSLISKTNIFRSKKIEPKFEKFEIANWEVFCYIVILTFWENNFCNLMRLIYESKFSVEVIFLTLSSFSTNFS